MGLKNVVFFTQQMRLNEKTYTPNQTQNMKKWKAMLQNLRNGTFTHQDSQTLSEKVCSVRDWLGTTNSVNSGKLTDDKWNKAHILVKENAVKHQLNFYKTVQYASEHNKLLYLCPSLDTKGKKLPSPKCTQILNSLHDQKTKGLLTVLPLVEGMPVLLTHNVATELGWSNGTSAHVCAIKLSEHDKNTKIDRITIKGMTVSVMQLENCPDYVLVENKSGRHEQLDGLSPTQFPITPRHDHFCTEIKTQHGGKFRLNVARTQIPLVPGFAWTIHKAQGKTLGAVIVDLWSQRA